MTATNHTLLVVIDDERDELSALGRATQLAEALNARIELFSCVFDSGIAAERLFGIGDLLPAKKRALLEQRERLEDIAKPLRDEGFTVDVDTAWDEPVYEGIVRKVLRSNPRMVLRSNTHYDRPRHSFFSNDDWNLMRQCPAPLMMTRPTLDEDDTFHICAAVDPMHHNDKPASLDHRIVQAANDLSGQLGGKLSIVHCYDAAPMIASIGAETSTPVVVDVKSITNQVRSAHWQAMQALVGREGLDESMIAHWEGKAKDVLPAYAAAKAVDVLVMGVVSRGFLKRHVIGSTAERVLDNLPCDLLLIKPEHFATRVKIQSNRRVAEDAA